MRRLIACLTLTFIIFSCSKSDDSPLITPEKAPNFYALTVGNSWVYKNYRYNPKTQDYEDTGVVDSISIVGTEEIDGKEYYKFRRLTTGNESKISLCNENGEHFEFYRELDGDLINDKDYIKFTKTNFEERLLVEHSWGDVFETRVKNDTVIKTEAGIFNCLKSERYAREKTGEKLNGLDCIHYSDGIGLIHDTTSSASNPTPIIKRRLHSYQVL